MMDEKRIEEMKRLTAEVKHGPWEIARNTDDDVFVTDIWIDDEDGGHIEIHGDTVASSINHAQFIAESRQFVPDIIAAYEEQSGIINAYADALKRRGIEIAVLRRALEFYADQQNNKPYKREAGAFHSRYSEDGGNIAREALAWRNTTRK